VKQVKCGCEFNADTLISLCDSHATYFAAKFRKDAPAVAPLNAKQEKLRDAILVAAAPARTGRLFMGAPVDQAADILVKYATSIAART